MKSGLVTLMLCLAALCSTAQTDSAAVEREILALERVGKLQACETKDLKTLEDMLDDSFVYIGPEGKYYSKSDLLAFVKSADLLQYVAKGMVVRLHGNTAIVTGVYQIKAVFHGKPSLERGRFVDTWMLVHGKWKGLASIDIPAQ